MKCPIYKDVCSKHGFTHGAEAEELRSGLEKLIDQQDNGRVLTVSIRRLLDRVDARDSLAYLEVTGNPGAE